MLAGVLIGRRARLRATQPVALKRGVLVLVLGSAQARWWEGSTVLIKESKVK